MQEEKAIEAGNEISELAPVVGNIVADMMRPVMQTIGKLLENNTAALEQLSATQAVVNDRLEALEKQIRLQTPVSNKQVTYLNDRIRHRSRELLSKRNIDDDRKAVNRLGGHIRRSVMSRYGVATLREIPKHEYLVAMSQIDTWNDPITVLDVVKEARKREDAG